MSKARVSVALFLATAVFFVFPSSARAGDQEVQELKRQIKILSDRVDQLEHEKGAPATTAPAPVTRAPAVAPATAGTLTAATEMMGGESPIASRGSMNDQQEAAPRPGDLTLDPKYRGFSPIPNTNTIRRSSSISTRWTGRTA